MSKPHKPTHAGSRQINQTLNKGSASWSVPDASTVAASPLGTAQAETSDVARELARKHPNPKESTTKSSMKKKTNSSLHPGHAQKTPSSTPASTRVGKSTLELVEFTDNLGVVHRIGFDPSGLVNLTHLADVAGENTENFLASSDVGLLRHHLAQTVKDDAFIAIPRLATRSKSGRRLRISARPPQREWWVHPAIAAYFLEYVDTPVLHAWFHWQRAARGWSRHPAWSSEFGFMPSDDETLIEELRTALRQCQRPVEVAAKPRPFTLKALPAAKTQLEKFTEMSPVANALADYRESARSIEIRAAELLAQLDELENEEVPHPSPAQNLGVMKDQPIRIAADSAQPTADQIGSRRVRHGKAF